MATDASLLRPDRAATVATAWCLTGVFVVLTTISLVTIERIKYLVLGDRAMASPLRLIGTLHAADYLLFAIGAALGLGVLGLEWRARGLSLLLAGRAPWALALSLGAMVLWFAHALLAPGLIVTGDGGTHVARVSHLAMAIRDGSSLYWDNFFFAGGTLLQFTGPVFHWIATAFTLLFGDPTVGVKAAAILSRFACAFFMFAYLRRVGLGRAAASLGCLFFGGSFFVSYMVSIRSTFPQIIILATLPAMLLGIEEVLTEPGIGRGWMVLTLAAIVLIGNHQPTAVMAAVLLALYVLARIGWDGWRPGPVRPLLLSAAVILVGSAFFLVPFVLERSWTAEGDLSQPLIALRWPRASELLNYVVWDRAGTGPVYTAYLGLSVIACALTGAPLALRAPREAAGRLWIIAAALAVVSLFLTGIYVRPAAFTFTFLCIAAAASVQMLQAAFPTFTRLPVLIFAVFIIDVGPSAIQPFTRTDMRGIARAGEALAERTDGERVLQVTPNSDALVSVGPDSTPLHYARVQMLHGPHKPDATKAHNGLAAALGLVGDDLGAHDTLSPQSRLYLGMLNVGWVVGVDGPRMGLPARFVGTMPDPVLGPYWRVPDPTPVLASGRLEQVDRPASFGGGPLWNGDLSQPAGRAAEADFSGLVARMDVDLAHRQAAQFLVPDAAAGLGVAGRGARARHRAWIVPRRSRPRASDRAVGSRRVPAPCAPDLSDRDDYAERGAGRRRGRRVLVHRAADRSRPQRHRGKRAPEPAAPRMLWRHGRDGAGVGGAARLRPKTQPSRCRFRRGTMMSGINLAEKLALFSDTFAPKIVASFNGHDVMVVKVKGEFVWHAHPDTDDFFLVLEGRLTIQLRDGNVELGPGELFVVPKGVEHRPVATEEAQLLLIEPKGTPNTGDAATAAAKVAI